jgi:hypothetical protein
MIIDDFSPRLNECRTVCFFVGDQLVTGAKSVAEFPYFPLDVAGGAVLTSSGIINASVLVSNSLYSP